MLGENAIEVNSQSKEFALAHLIQSIIGAPSQTRAGIPARAAEQSVALTLRQIHLTSGRFRQACLG